MQWSNPVYDRLASQLVLLDMKMAFCWKYCPVCLQTDLCIYLFVCLLRYLFNPLAGHKLIWYIATPGDCGYLCKDEHFIIIIIIIMDKFIVIIIIIMNKFILHNYQYKIFNWA